MSYVPKETGEAANKTLAILSMSFGIAGCFGAVLLFWFFWSVMMSMWVGAASPWFTSFEVWLYIGIGGAPFAIAGFVLGMVSKGSPKADSEIRHMAIAGMLCGITYLAHAVGVFGLWLTYKLLEAAII